MISPRVFLNLLFDITSVLDLKPGTFSEMATGGGIALPEPLDCEDAKSWFECYEVCATVNG